MMSVVHVLGIGGALAVVAVAYVRIRRSREMRRLADGRFLLAFSGLLAAMAAANGEVAPEEFALIEGYFGKMGLSAAERALCFGNFMVVARERRDARAFARELTGRFGRTCRNFLYSLVWQVALADGNVDADEDRLLRDIAGEFGFGVEVYAWFKANELPVLDRRELRRDGVPASLLHLAKTRRR